MSRKRFCDLCGIELPPHERYFSVLLGVKKDGHGEAAITQQEYADLCYSCVRNGDALTALVKSYEQRTPLTGLVE